MSQQYDVSLKALFLREGHGLVRSLLFGGRVTEVLATEQPQVFNRRADLLARSERGVLHQVEFQATNEARIPQRLLRYYVYYEDLYGEHIVQTVLYMGREPMRLEDFYETPSLRFRFNIVNLRELDAEPLLASPDWVDNVLALLAKGSPARALEVVLPRIRALQGEEQELAAGTLTLLSGILGLEDFVGEKLKEVGMIDVMENKILGPAIRKGIEQGLEQGRQEGRQEGREEGQHALFQKFLVGKFGDLPAWASKRLASATSEDLDRWAKQIFTSTSLKDLLG